MLDEVEFAGSSTAVWRLSRLSVESSGLLRDIIVRTAATNCKILTIIIHSDIFLKDLPAVQLRTQSVL